MSKYDPLWAFLESTASCVSETTLSYGQVQVILGSSLPPSARKHRAWWANPGSTHDHPYAQAWLAAGWEVDTVDQRAERFRLRRLG
jgi:hypothetical protein